MRKKAIWAVLAMLAFGNAMSVSAATSATINTATYSAYVTRGTDFVVEDPLYKVTKKEDGTNDVTNIDSGRALCSWINNFMGMKVTDQANYSGIGKVYMEFSKEADIEHPGINLSTKMAISTRWYEFDSANTSGKWSPDTF